MSKKIKPGIELRSNMTVLGPPSGGEMSLLSSEGELLATLYVGPGRHRATHWLDLFNPGDTVEPGPGVAIFQPAHRIRVMGFGAQQNESAANPNYRPPSQAERQARSLERRLDMIEARERRLLLQQRALNRARGPDPEPAAPVAAATVEPAAGGDDASQP